MVGHALILGIVLYTAGTIVVLAALNRLEEGSPSPADLIGPLLVLVQWALLAVWTSVRARVGGRTGRQE